MPTRAVPQRLGLVVFALALVVLVGVARPGQATPQSLWPGVTYERGVQFTPHGPVAISILRGPRPGGVTTLEPILSNDSLLGRETLTGMERRVAGSAVTAGVNGDYFTLATGRPSGVFMQDGVLVNPPRSARASAGITSDGRLDIRRVSFFGSWQGTGAKHPLAAFNEAPDAERGRPVHRPVRPVHAARPRRDARRALPVPGGRSRARPPGGRR